MTFPANLTTVTVTGRYIDFNEQPVSGTVTFEPILDGFLSVPSNDTILIPTTVVVSLDVTGAFSVELPATNDSDADPIGFAYKVTESFAPFSRTYTIALPYDTLAVDLSLPQTVTEVTPTAPIVRTVNGLHPDSTGDVTIATSETGPRMTYARWLATRGTPYFIAHRGSGDVYPENSWAAFRHAVDRGATAMEVSVHQTADGVLVVNHDSTWDRTTTISGTVATTPSTALQAIKIDDMTQVGPAWSGANGPAVVRFEDILREFGGKVVIFAEAKADSAYPAMIQMIQKYGLQDTIAIKAFYTSPRIDEAKLTGYPVFAYFGSKSEVTTSSLASLVAQNVDYIVLPFFDADQLTPMPDATVNQCVATGIPVLMYPVHRRADITKNTARGVAGFVVASYGYTNTSTAIAARDSWWTSAAELGQLVLDPSVTTYAPTWVSPNILRLGRSGGQHFVSLGQLSPLVNATGTYQVDFDARWSTLPADTVQNLTLAFGRADDGYYQHQYGKGSGYHAIMRASGLVQLYRHTDGSTSGTQLGSTATTAAAVANTWMTFRLNVTPSSITWARLDASGTVTVSDTTHRGGYIHIGKSSNDGVLDIRNLIIT